MIDDIIPSTVLGRPHVVECRREPGARWCEYGRAPDRATALQRLRELSLQLGADNVRMRPVNASDPKALHPDDRAALLLAVAVGRITPGRLTAELGDAKRQAVRIRASHALRRLREGALIESVPGSTNGAHVATEGGRALAHILDERKTP